MALPTRITLIEDNPADVYWLHEALREVPVAYELRVYPNAVAALAHLEEWKRSDLLMLDWFLPLMDADEFLATLRKNAEVSPPLMAVFVPWPFSEFRNRAFALGAFSCLVKPVDAAQLTRLFSQLKERSAAAATCRGPEITGALRIRPGREQRLLLELSRLRRRADRVLADSFYLKRAIAAGLTRNRDLWARYQQACSSFPPP